MVRASMRYTLELGRRMVDVSEHLTTANSHRSKVQDDAMYKED
jgi:hypothetical protein